MDSLGNFIFKANMLPGEQLFLGIAVAAVVIIAFYAFGQGEHFSLKQVIAGLQAIVKDIKEQLTFDERFLDDIQDPALYDTQTEPDTLTYIGYKKAYVHNLSLDLEKSTGNICFLGMMGTHYGCNDTSDKNGGFHMYAKFEEAQNHDQGTNSFTYLEVMPFGDIAYYEKGCISTKQRVLQVILPKTCDICHSTDAGYLVNRIKNKMWVPLCMDCHLKFPIENSYNYVTLVERSWTFGESKISFSLAENSILYKDGDYYEISKFRNTKLTEKQERIVKDTFEHAFHYTA